MKLFSSSPMCEKLNMLDERFALYQQAVRLLALDELDPQGLEIMRAAAAKGSLDAVAYLVVVDNGCSEVGQLSSVKDNQRRKTIISDLRKLQKFGGQYSYQLGIILAVEAKTDPSLILESVRCIAEGASPKKSDEVNRCCALAIKAANHFKNDALKRDEMLPSEYLRYISKESRLTDVELRALDNFLGKACAEPANSNIVLELKFYRGLLLYYGSQKNDESTQSRKSKGRDFIIDAANGGCVKAYTLAGKILFAERDKRVQACKLLLLAKDDPEAKAFRDEMIAKGDKGSLEAAEAELAKNSSGSYLPASISSPSAVAPSSLPKNAGSHPPPSIIKKKSDDEKKED